MRKRERLLLTHECAEQIARVAGVAQHIDVCTTVGDANQRARVAKLPCHAFLVNVEQRCHIVNGKVVLKREVKEGVERGHATVTSNFGDTLPFDCLERRVGDFFDLGALPHVVKDATTFEFRRKRTPKISSGVDFLLGFTIFVFEHRLHRVHTREQERITQIELNDKWTYSNLWAAAALEQRRNLLQRFSPGLGRIVAIAQVEPRYWPATL